jgi:hypothetical protein
VTNEFTYRFVPAKGQGALPLLLLHGTGGDEHCGGIIDPRTHRTLDYAHIQVSDLMKLPGRVKVGQPGTVTGGKRR